MAKKNTKRGFTLVELIVVLVILAVLAALLIPALTGYIDKARKSQVVAETRMLTQAVQTEMSTLYASDEYGFTNKLVNGETIKIFNYGNCKRDFTYVDDIVEGVVRVMTKAPEKKNGEDGLPIPPYAVYNIGNSNPENLLDFVQILSEELVRAGVLPADYDFETHKELVPMQPGDVPVTFADTEPLERDFGFKPHTPLREGLRKFAEWYKEFYMGV